MSFPQTADPTMSVDTTSTYGVLMPPTVNAGDLLIMCCNWDGTHVITTPAGWTKPTNGEGDASGNQLGIIFLKVADGTEDGATVAITSDADNNFAAHVYRVTSWFGTLAGVELAVRTSLANGDVGNSPSLTPSWGNRDTLWISFIAFCEATGIDTTATAAPANYTNLNQNVQGLGSGGARSISARRELKTATEDPGVFTHTDPAPINAGQADFTIAIRPTDSTAPGGRNKPKPPKGGGGGGAEHWPYSMGRESEALHYAPELRRVA